VSLTLCLCRRFGGIQRRHCSTMATASRKRMAAWLLSSARLRSSPPETLPVPVF
jgi:hypothetical protein